MTDSTRVEFIQGLRAMADALEADEGLPIPNMSPPTAWPSTREEPVQTRTVQVEEPIYEWECDDPVLNAVNKDASAA